MKFKTVTGLVMCYGVTAVFFLSVLNVSTLFGFFSDANQFSAHVHLGLCGV